MVSRDVFGGKLGVWLSDADKGNILAAGKLPQQAGNVVVGKAGNRDSKGRFGIRVRLLVCIRLGRGNRICIEKPTVVIAATTSRNIKVLAGIILTPIF